ncbi:MAG: methyltransferase domain-containing protein [Rugosibacter sp.]|nr:methyltransferase domain-containing protein [Rugosibacter sp.]
MFFPEKITSIRPKDKVLEIGPGGTPHPRSNTFLELKFNTDQEKIAQRGNVVQEPRFGNRPVHYYDGGKFPFGDAQFDYVICSHVIEHVADPAGFLEEIFRVGSGRGYLEYPLITYEYLYDFDVHLHFVKFDFEEGVLRYLPKRDTAFPEFSAVTSLFNKTLVRGWDDLCSGNKKLFFEGVEFNQPFVVEKTCELQKLLPDQSLIVTKKTIRKRVGQILNRLGF